MKILFVDDSIFVQKVMRKVLHENIPGCEVVITDDGEKGYSLYQDIKPDYVITDLLMPRSSGHELIRRIRKNDSKTQIIVISADVQKATKEEVEAMGIFAFFNKPLTEDKSQILINLIKGA